MAETSTFGGLPSTGAMAACVALRRRNQTTTAGGDESRVEPSQCPVATTLPLRVRNRLQWPESVT